MFLIRGWLGNHVSPVSDAAAMSRIERESSAENEGLDGAAEHRHTVIAMGESSVTGNSSNRDNEQALSTLCSEQRGREFREYIEQLPVTLPPFFTMGQSLIACSLSYEVASSWEALQETRHLAWCLGQEGIREEHRSIFQKTASQVLEKFKENAKNLAHIQELVALGAINNPGFHCEITEAVQHALERHEGQSSDLALSRGLLAMMLSRAELTSDPNTPEDFTALLTALILSLEKIRRNQNILQVQMLLETVSMLLDQMLDCGVEKIGRDEHTRLTKKLRDLEKSYPKLAWPISYAQQALACFDRETLWETVSRDFMPSAIGGQYLMDQALKIAVAAYAVKDTPGVAKRLGLASAIFVALSPEKIESTSKALWGVVKSFRSDNVQSWYRDLRKLDEMLKSWLKDNRLDLFEAFLYKNDSYDVNFLLGLCDRLERIACMQITNTTQKSALRLLKGLSEGNISWGKHEAVELYAKEILFERMVLWKAPNINEMQHYGYAPPAWHPFWQSQPQSKLLQEVQKNVQQQKHIELLPGIKDAVTGSAAAVNALAQHVLPKPLNDWLPKAQKALANHYESDLKIKRLSGKELPLKDCYINLAIVEDKARQEKDQAEPKARSSPSYRLSSYEEIKQTNLQELIPIEKLFDPRKLLDDRENIPKVPKRILIRGRAGIGKTTLCKKLVDLYYQTEEWRGRFEAVIWLPLRQLKAKNKAETYKAGNLGKLLEIKYFFQDPDNANLADQLFRYANESPDKVLFILDGLDEVSTELGKSSPLGKFLADLLKRRWVVVTSRPTEVNPSHLGEFDLELETIGFSPEDVWTYLEKIEPKNKDEIQKLIEHIPTIRELVNIPVMLDALSYSWKEIKAISDKQKSNDSAQELRVTATTLYQVIVDKLLRKDADNLGKEDNNKLIETVDLWRATPEKVEELMESEIDYLSYLGFKGLQANLFEFDTLYLGNVNKALEEIRKRKKEKVLSWSLERDVESACSFLDTAYANVDENDRAYNFLHSTFQEFFAAKFLAKHFQAYLTAEGEYKTQADVTESGLRLDRQELQKFVAHHKYDPRYQSVWQIVAGLLEGGTLEGFLHLLEKESQDSNKDTHLVLLMHALHEARARLSDTTIQRLEKVLEGGLLLALKSKEKYKHILLGIDLAFPEALLLKFGEHNLKYRDWIYQILGWRRTLSDQAVVKLEKAFRDKASDISVILRVGLRADVFKVEALRDALVARFNAETAPMALKALATALGEHASDNEAVREVLVARFKTEKAPEAIVALAAGLGRRASENEAIRDALVARFIKAETVLDIIAALAAGLGGYASENEAIRDALVARFNAETIAALAAGLGGYTSEAVRSLLTWFKVETALEAIDALAAVLSRYASNNEAVRDVLVRWLKAETVPDAIVALAKGLGGYASENEAIRDALVARFKAETAAPMAIAALAAVLGMYASENKAFREVLTARFKAETAPEAIGALAMGLGRYASENEAIRDALVARLKAETVPETIAALAEGLGMYASENEAIRDALVARLKAETVPEAIAALAEGLGEYASDVEAVREVLMARLKAEAEPKAKVALIQGLGKHMGSLDEEFQSALIAAQDSKNLEEALIT